jgi:hypothetical protein
MIDEEMLQKILSMTIERIGKQTTSYEAEIANLNAQILILNKQLSNVAPVPAPEPSSMIKDDED